MRSTADVTGGKPIAVLLQSISGVSAINPLVAFYDIHGGKRKALFFYFVPDTTRDDNNNNADIQKFIKMVQQFSHLIESCSFIRYQIILNCNQKRIMLFILIEYDPIKHFQLMKPPPNCLIKTSHGTVKSNLGRHENVKDGIKGASYAYKPTV
jgi:hypothetical protein